MLATLVALLAAATVAVPLSRRFGFGSVLGYLVAGVAIGPAGLRLVTDVGEITSISSLGVVMLLFLIGLEVRPRRLWVMRRSVFGLGAAQVVLCGTVLAVLAHAAAGLAWPAATVIGAGMALSSTAIVLPMLAERDLLTSRAGRDGFAVLLFQDLAFIPLVALVPLMAAGHPVPEHVPWHGVVRAAIAVVVILLGGRFLMRPLFQAIGGAQTPELFTTVSLLVVVGTALLAMTAGLSPSLGAFMAGVLLSGSEYRHELQADIAPFEGLLLGFFFISVGMSADLHLARAVPGLLVGGTAVLLLAKTLTGYGLARLGRHDRVNALRFALALPQASEFSFVLFSAAVAAGALGAGDARLATLIAAVSMLATPIIFAASEALLVRRVRAPPPAYDTILSDGSPVIIAGFGRVGQIVGRVLAMHGIRFTALERDPGQVDVVRRYGNKVYFGDSTRPEVLRAAGAAEAKVLVVTLDDMEGVLRTVDAAKRHFPGLKIQARARNRRHAHLLMDREVDWLVRDTYFSSLALAEHALTALGIEADAASNAITLFRDHDEKALQASHPFYRDEAKLIQTSQDAATELASLFEADREQR